MVSIDRHIVQRKNVRRTVISMEEADGFTGILSKVWLTIVSLVAGFAAQIKKKSTDLQEMYKIRMTAYPTRLKTMAASSKPDSGTVEVPSRKIEEMTWFVGYSGIDWKPGADVSTDDIIKNLKSGMDKCPEVFKRNMEGFLHVYKLIATTLNNPDLPKQYANGFDKIVGDLFLKVAGEIKQSVPAFSNASPEQLVKDLKSGSFWKHFQNMDKGKSSDKSNLNLPDSIRIKITNFVAYRDFLGSVARDLGKVIELVPANQKLLDGQQEVVKAMTNFNTRLRGTGQTQLQPSHRDLMRLCSNARVVTGAFVIMAKRGVTVTDTAYGIGSLYAGGGKKPAQKPGVNQNEPK